MSLVESLFNMLKDVDCQDELIEGFTMEPIKKGYKLYHEKQYVASVSFIKENNEEYDMETASDFPKDYNVYITEIKQEDKIKKYIKKLTDLGFVNVEQK
jgi:hypothetical protein